MPGPWSVDGAGNRRFTCFSKACRQAAILLRQTRRAVRVRYLGPKRPGNRHINQSDFLMTPDGRRDPTIDPTWYTNQGKGR